MNKIGILLILLMPLLAAGQSKTVTAPNGQSHRIASTDAFRGNDELCFYTVGFYAKKPPSEAGVDVYVVEGRIAEIRDRAGAVFLQNKPDPGPVAVGKDGFVLSAHGAARRWVLANLKVGDAVSLDGKAPVSAVSPYAYYGHGMLQTAGGKTYYFDGKNSARSQDLVIYYSADAYLKSPPNEAGVDILVTAGRVVEVRDRAGIVFLEKKADPGPLRIADPAGSFVISGNGEGRKWLVANIRTGEEISVSGIDLSKEVAPLATVPCFPGAIYRKAVTSFDSWTGIGGLVKLGTPKTDDARIGPDAGLTWEFTVDETGRKSEKRNAFRPFWRTKSWNSAPAKKEFYYYPGETVQMAVLVAGVGKLRLIVTDGKSKVFQTEFDAEGFVAGVPRQFKRVNAIDQVGNEGRPAQPTRAEITGAEWLQTVVIRGEGTAAQQLILTPERFTDMRCGAGNVVLGPFDRTKGGERIDLFGKL
jgi:hypothetical protein